MDTVKLEFPDGIVECRILGSFALENKDYVALVPNEESDDVYLYGYRKNGEEIELLNLTPEEFDRAAAEFGRIMQESEK